MNNLPILLPLWLLLRGLEPPYSNGLKVDLHLGTTMDWIEQAHLSAGDGGLSKGYDLLRGKWAPSYPETTGYSIPSLLNAAQRLNRPELMDLAVSLADYLLARATPEGGVIHWQSEASPIVFDTGQVIFGWLAAYESTQKDVYIQAATKAANWLVSIQDSCGAWMKNQYLGVEKVIDTRVAWALLELHQRIQNSAYFQTAIKNLEWALQQQEADGWFNHCAFTTDEDPFTHTIAYTAEGLFECGRLLNEPRYTQAAKKTADAMLNKQHADGRLASTYGRQWEATSRSSCLTGNCQMGILWLNLYQWSGLPAYYRAAEKAIAFVARTQITTGSLPNIKGGISGSYPITGRYERLKFPNWAAKFFADALLKLGSVQNNEMRLTFVG